MKAPQAAKATATLPIPHGVSNLITLAHTIVTKMTGNPYFPSPNPSLATVLGTLTALGGAEVVAQTRAKGAVEARDAQERVLRDQLKYLKVYVQSIADGDAANAEAIITSSGHSVRKAKTGSKQDLVAKMGKASGQIKLVAKSAGQRATYDWAWSLDQKAWTDLPQTMQAKTTMTVTTVPVTYYFRFRTLLPKTGLGDWSQVVSLMVT